MIHLLPIRYFTTADNQSPDCTPPPVAEEIIDEQVRELEQVFGPARSLDRVEAHLLIDVPPFMKAKERLVVRLTTLPGSRKIRVAGQDFDQQIDRDGLNAVLAFADQERVANFLSKLPSA